VTEIDLSHWGAKFGSPAIFVSLVEWADRIITEWSAFAAAVIAAIGLTRAESRTRQCFRNQ